MGDPLVRRGQLGDMDLSPLAAGPRMPMVIVALEHVSLLGWDRVSAVHRGGGHHPQPMWGPASISLLVPISPRCSGRGQAAAGGTS